MSVIRSYDTACGGATDRTGIVAAGDFAGNVRIAIRPHNTTSGHTSDIFSVIAATNRAEINPHNTASVCCSLNSSVVGTVLDRSAICANHTANKHVITCACNRTIIGAVCYDASVPIPSYYTTDVIATFNSNITDTITDCASVISHYATITIYSGT